jgi:hypothetical protein
VLLITQIYGCLMLENSQMNHSIKHKKFYCLQSGWETVYSWENIPLAAILDFLRKFFSMMFSFFWTLSPTFTFLLSISGSPVISGGKIRVRKNNNNYNFDKNAAFHVLNKHDLSNQVSLTVKRFLLEKNISYL